MQSPSGCATSSEQQRLAGGERGCEGHKRDGKKRVHAKAYRVSDEPLIALDMHFTVSLCNAISFQANSILGLLPG